MGGGGAAVNRVGGRGWVGGLGGGGSSLGSRVGGRSGGTTIVLSCGWTDNEHDNRD